MRQPYVILHDRVAAEKAVLDPQPFENPLRDVPLLRGRRLVGLQDRVNHRNQRAELRLFGLLGPHVVVSRLNPKNRAASRRLFPSTKINRRTAA